jgi:uncharacterized protein (TIGR02284 family)
VDDALAANKIADMIALALPVEGQPLSSVDKIAAECAAVLHVEKPRKPLSHRALKIRWEPRHDLGYSVAHRLHRQLIEAALWIYVQMQANSIPIRATGALRLNRTRNGEGDMELSPQTLDRIQQLISANFAVRDELYAAARSLDDEARQQVCRRLAEHLAGHAVELQQILTASGERPVGPLDMNSLAEALFESAKQSHGESGVLAAAVEREHNLKEDYDRALDYVSQPQAENVLKRQREGVEFGEQVLRGMSAPDKPKGRRKKTR